MSQTPPTTPDAPPASPPARLTVGSTMRHVVEMTFAGSVGLVAIFLVDFLSLFYVSMLRDEKLTAGIGYASTVLFLVISINVGLMIASAALVARALGAGNRDLARRTATAGALFCSALAALVSVAMLAALPVTLDFLGATGVSRDVATRFLWITLPANAFMAFGMVLSSTLRAVGDARRAMMVTLLGGVATAFLDPLFIFGFQMGTDGAALATVISRLVFCLVGWRGVVTHHDLMAAPSRGDLTRTIAPLLGIAIPAVLTNIATPVANGYILSVMRQFGDEAVAANTIIDRLVPLAFGVLFALTGAVGPILAQNLGAGRFDRVRQAMRDSLIFAVVYCLIMWAVLALGRNSIAGIFGASARTSEFVGYFCLYGAAAWVFIGLLFVANTAFNNLGFPIYSTLFNWGRATLGTIPLVMIGAEMGGFQGVLVAIIFGAAIFGISGVIVAFRAIRTLELRKTKG